MPAFDFEPKQHFELGENLGLMDFDLAAKMSGSRFVVLRGALARLERALATFMLDLQSGEHGYEETVAPLLVRDEAVFGTAQLPKFSEDLFRTENGYWLIPTGEVPLTNLVREQIVDEGDLPLRFTAHTPCFQVRSRVGGQGYPRHDQTASVLQGRDGIDRPSRIRQRIEHERMTGCAEEVLKRLGPILPGDAAVHRRYGLFGAANL